ncbi:hypothetical protein [Leptolyngbya sp. FACHB-711]|uniref:hypothetical protein n=1 Tax=unclassified Leptolyngbya TaxID=2650499 RepID=UPI0016890E30|nr:hypothetical protein [Leptolyngbya sp. FACHB-711]MBD1851285.1 hypothetical protein [Cyanobacteria bacterium FACHB-502]MBD2026980.1 hypothetical protein [Leptolyngbya sp. FACHB-711]
MKTQNGLSLISNCPIELLLKVSTKSPFYHKLTGLVDLPISSGKRHGRDFAKENGFTFQLHPQHLQQSP